MTAPKKAAKKTARRVAKPQQETTAALDTLLKPTEVRYTEGQLFGTAPSAVFLDETTEVVVGESPSETRTIQQNPATAAPYGEEFTPSEQEAIAYAAELAQAEVPRAPRSLADWIAEEATQGRFYGSLGAAQVGYGLMLARRAGGAL